jgi:hypothetical protein
MPSLVAAILLVDLSVTTIGDGHVPVTVTVESDKPFRLRKVTYHCGGRETVDQVLEFPHADWKWLLQDATIRDNRAFFVDVPTSDHVSLFGILKNTFSWCRFAVFRIECEAREPVFLSTAVSDPRTTKSLTIKIP